MDRSSFSHQDFLKDEIVGDHGEFLFCYIENVICYICNIVIEVEGNCEIVIHKIFNIFVQRE